VFAAVQPQNQLVTGWTGDASLLDDPSVALDARHAGRRRERDGTIVARPVTSR
jgi:hypothetical protein